jgi:hypothetical protein
MTVDLFIESLESAYGQYKAGMKDAVRQAFKYAKGGALDDLYKAVLREHQQQSVPNVGVVSRIARERSIPLYDDKTDTATWVSICEHCGTRYSMDAYLCPGCAKRRKYGIVEPRWAK